MTVCTDKSITAQDKFKFILLYQKLNLTISSTVGIFEPSRKITIGTSTRLKSRQRTHNKPMSSLSQGCINPLEGHPA